MNIFARSANVTVGVSILSFCPTTDKLYREMLSDKGNRFYFLFPLTTHYQNDEFISFCSECDKFLREVFNFTHKNYFNNCKGCLIRCYEKKERKKVHF